MPHMSIAALIPLVLDSIQKLLPIIEKFIHMFSGHADNYTQGKDSLETYLKNVNDDLSTLQQAAASDGDPSNDFTIPDKIDSAQEATEMADKLQELLDNNKSTMSAQMQVDFEKTIAGLRKAADELTAKGRLTDPGSPQINDIPSANLSPSA
jgi:uncharacterized phage infection (PIP) family protein YhgE